MIVIAASQQIFAVGFHCYSMPNMAVSGYEFGSSNCGQVPTNAMGVKIQQDGEKDILCMISTSCEVVSNEEAKMPAPTRTSGELYEMYNKGQIKNSMLICKGKGLVKGGLLLSTECPPPEKCHSDVFYNHASWAANPANSQGTNIVKPVVYPSSTAQ